MAARPWQGAETSTSLQRSYAENGQRLAAMLGLKQSLKLTERLMVDAGLDRVQSLRNRPAARPLPAAADPYPATDYTAVSTGAAYQFERFTWTSRAEVRRADDQDKWGITSGAYGEPRPGLGLSAAVRMLASDARRGQQTTDAALRFGLVWRPDESRWMVLNRADYIAGDQQGGLFVADNRRLVNNLKAHWQIGARQELAVTWGAKYVIETIDGREYSGLVNMAAVEHRYDVTPRWDVGVHSSLLHAAENGSVRYGAGASLGYQVADNVWLSAGYQVAGYEDADFSRFEYTAHGPFVRFRIKLDQESAPRAAGMLLGLFSPAGEPGRVAANGPAAPRAPHTPARPGEQRPTAK